MIDELLELSRAGEHDAAGELVATEDVVGRAVQRWHGAAADRGQRVVVAADGLGAGAGGLAADGLSAGAGGLAAGAGGAAAGAGGLGIQAGSPGADTGRVWVAVADADRIVDALVENALRYSPAGSEVEIAALASGVAVRDRGSGLADGEADEVFERFHRGSAGRRGVAGSGLGLAIARELARRWGGDVALRPRAGGGTVAELLLGSPPSPGGANAAQISGKALANPATHQGPVA